MARNRVQWRPGVENAVVSGSATALLITDSVRLFLTMRFLQECFKTELDFT